MELVSFDLCPFVQRSVITLKIKGVEYDITYIDLRDPPDWFSAISPLGKVPLMRDQGEVLFESAAINEYIDETVGEPLHPEEPLRRAHNRAWIEFASELLGVQYRSQTAREESSWSTAVDTRDALLDRLEEQLSGGPWFNGSVLSLADCAFAPYFTRQQLLESRHERESLARWPKVRQWRDALLALPAVAESVVPDFAERFEQALRREGSFVIGR